MKTNLEPSEIYKDAFENSIETEKEDAFENNVETEKEDASTETQWIPDYGISIMPNDFNVLTLFNLIKREKIKIPQFQRNFVWNKRQSSKLIESFILGLPVPQLYLYQDEDGTLKVIDGLQRLLTLFFFISGRFPKDAARTIFENSVFIDKSTLDDDDKFQNFSLSLPNLTTQSNEVDTNPLNGKKYNQLDFNLSGYNPKEKLELATVRTIIIKQLSPKEANPSSMFEIFNRLNTSGTKLNSQEIRMSIYYSNFFDMVIKLNKNPIWRNQVFGIEQCDSRMRDIELIFRVFALVTAAAQNTNKEINYKPSMSSFINNFCFSAKKFDDNIIDLYKNIFINFINQFSEVRKPFNNVGGKFTIAFFDAVFVALTEKALSKQDASLVHPFDSTSFDELKNNEQFKSASLESTASANNVKTRINLARKLMTR